MSKAIVINIPTTFKEVKGRFKNTFKNSVKTMTHPYRRKHNAAVISKLQQDIFNEINRGYWSKDISDYARKTLTNPFNGDIHKMITEAYRKLK